MKKLMNKKVYLVMPAVTGILSGFIVALGISMTNQAEINTKEITPVAVAETHTHFPVIQQVFESEERAIQTPVEIISKDEFEINEATLEIARKFGEIPVLSVPNLSSFNMTATFTDIPEPSQVHNFNEHDLNPEFYSEPIYLSASSALYDQTGITEESLNDPYLFHDNNYD